MILGGFNNATMVGGAVSLRGKASATLAGCIFMRNQAGLHGGAVAVMEESSATFIGCTFLDNEALGGVGGAVAVGSSEAAAGEVVFQGCYFKRNEAFSGGDPELDPASRFGGALALVRSTSTVTINGSNFDSNTADAGAAIWAGTPVRVSSSQILTSFGDGIHIRNTEAVLDTIIVSENMNLVNFDAGAGLTCTGSSGKITATTSSFSDNGSGRMGGGALIQSGCSASFFGCTFEKNFAVMGAGVALGELNEEAAAPTDAGAVSFTKCIFRENNAAGVNDPNGELEIAGTKITIPVESGMGGGLAVFGASSPVRIEQCMFRKNEAFMGGGLFSADAIELTGEPSGFDENTAGFAWYTDAELKPTQMGGGALVMMTAAKRGGAVRINNSLFHRNIALGAFGGGLAVIGANIHFSGTTFIQNQVLGDSSQGGGLYVQSSNVTDDSNYLATDNNAMGAFLNVFLADEAIAVVDGGKATTNMRSCYQCSPCQICSVKSGRCQFPPKLEEWCKFTNSCNKDSCPFVTIGAAVFDESNFRSLSIDIDIPYTVSAEGSGTAIPCSAAFAAESLPTLGKGATCKLTSKASGTGRRRVLLGPTGNQLIVNLGADFTAGPGSTLQMLTSGLPSQYSGLSDSAIVQISQATVRRSVLESGLQIANGTLASAFTASTSTGAGAGAGAEAGVGFGTFRSGAFAGARAPQGLGSALLLILTTLLASLLATLL
eukprot:tig00001269_g7973.t1